MVEVLDDARTEILVMIDEFINDISGQNIIDTTFVIDRLLDIRNLSEKTIVPN